MKGDKAIQYLATRIGQLEADKSLLLAQLDTLNEAVEQLKKEVEQIGSNPKGTRPNETESS